MFFIQSRSHLTHLGVGITKETLQGTAHQEPKKAASSHLQGTATQVVVDMTFEAPLFIGKKELLGVTMDNLTIQQ